MMTTHHRRENQTQLSSFYSSNPSSCYSSSLSSSSLASQPYPSSSSSSPDPPSTSVAAAADSLPVEDLQKNLPRFNYDARLESAKDCAVCLECFKEGEWCRRLRDCNHVFHVSCVDSWLAKVLNCPICRAPINLNPFGSGSFMSEDDDFKLWWPVGV